MSILPFRRPEKPEEPAHHQRAGELAEETGKPHGAGEMFCMACNHTWAGVAPIGQTEAFECPACHAHRGRWRFDFCPSDSDDQVWTCNCGNQLFNITRRGTFCPGCGEYMRF